MFIRTALTNEAHSALVAFCAENLKTGLDPEQYADGFDVDLGEVGGVAGALFEIRGFDTKTGNPATISFRDDAEFVTEEIED